MDYHTRLHSSSGTLLTDPLIYQRLLGRLIYLTTTRPDIAFVVQHLSQFVSSPTTAHHQAAFRVLYGKMGKNEAVELEIVWFMGECC